MNGYRHPDPQIEAWLADGPTTLSGTATMAIKSAARTLPQRRGVAVPWSNPNRSTRPMLLAAAAVLVAAATLAVAVGVPLWFAPDPEPTGRPTSSRVSASPAALASPPIIVTGVNCFPLDEQPPGAAPIGRAVLLHDRVAVEYALPLETGLRVVLVGGSLGFIDDQGRGIAVVDVTETKRHGSLVQQPPLGTDARTFLEELDKRFPYVDGQVIDYDVTDLTPTTLGGRAAWSAVVTWSAEHSSWTHIDRSVYGPTESACALEFDVPHRLFVVDVSPAVVAVQIWAATEPDLAAWLPEAIPLADSLRIMEQSR